MYGSPVPGYAAPADTVVPAARVVRVFLTILVEGVASGAVSTSGSIETTRGVRKDLSVLRGEAPGVPDVVLSRGVLVWTHLFGLISYELFGHLHGGVTDYAAFFDVQARSWARLIAHGA